MINYKQQLTDMYNELDEFIIKIENEEVEQEEILSFLIELCDNINSFRFELEDDIQDLLEQISCLTQLLPIDWEEC